MKVKVLSLLVPALLVAGAANAAEIYNKDGNKLDLYGKIDGLHYFSDDKSVDGDQTYMRVGVKGETQINDQLTGYGQWEYNVQANNTESSSDQAWTRLAFAGLKFGDAGSFDGTVAKLAMRQPFVLFKGLTFQKLCLPGAFRPGDHHN
ncbi:porin, partial [Klebsiella pneumoniae]|uniref:porin n=1 Tax=Klebsiella pneumoniae TaxID=573 RepID=UPI002362AC89